jgi:hypothetical protein
LRWGAAANLAAKTFAHLLPPVLLETTENRADEKCEDDSLHAWVKPAPKSTPLNNFMRIPSGINLECD